ncbi:MAG: hypothetical protein ABFD60_11360 [Bryobacteraceae bacterium]
MRRLVGLGLLFLLGGALQAQRWDLQYFLDKRKEALVINDLKFSSAERGVAVGVMTGSRGFEKPAMLVTRDGGRTWTNVKFKDVGLSLFFLNESVGWVVTQDGIWKTVEAGYSWHKQRSPRGVLRVHFRDEMHGWAVGMGKGVWETADGGRNWKRVDVTDKVKSSADYTSFTWITFTKEGRGLIAGASILPRRGESFLPDWMDPDIRTKRREWPGMTILLETLDGGRNWSAQTMSLFGQVTHVAFAGQGVGLGLIEFLRYFEWPSEVFRFNLRSGQSERAFRRMDRAVTDIAVTPSGTAYLVAFEPSGKFFRAPIPGKLRILSSRDLENWHEMKVDYRAVARRAVLSVVDDEHIWVATDTGMILKLNPAASR